MEEEEEDEEEEEEEEEEEGKEEEGGARRDHSSSTPLPQEVLLDEETKWGPSNFPLSTLFSSHLKKGSLSISF